MQSRRALRAGPRIATAFAEQPPFFFSGAAVRNLADMPQHQSACEDGQCCQHSPKGRVNAHQTQLAAAQSGKEHGLVGRGIEVANEL